MVNAVVDEWVANGNMSKYVDYYDALAKGETPNAGDLKVTWDFGSATEVLTVYTESGIYTEPCELRSYALERQLDDMHDMLGGGEMKESYDDFIRPVFILEALDASLKSGKIEPVRILPV